MHLSIKFDAYIFIQSGVIDIFPKFKMAGAAILNLGTTHEGSFVVRTPCKNFVMIGWKYDSGKLAICPDHRRRRVEVKVCMPGGRPPVCSSTYQLLLKSVQWLSRCGWSKIALSHYFGPMAYTTACTTVSAVISLFEPSEVMVNEWDWGRAFFSVQFYTKVQF